MVFPKWSTPLCNVNKCNANLCYTVCASDFCTGAYSTFSEILWRINKCVNNSECKPEVKFYHHTCMKILNFILVSHAKEKYINWGLLLQSESGLYEQATRQGILQFNSIIRLLSPSCLMEPEHRNIGQVNRNPERGKVSACQSNCVLAQLLR